MRKKNDGKQKGLRLVKSGEKEEAPVEVEASVIKLDKIRDRVRELETLCTRKIDASQNFNIAATAAAQVAGLEATVVKKFITARVKDTERKDAKQAEQLQLLFEEIPL